LENTESVTGAAADGELSDDALADGLALPSDALADGLAFPSELPPLEQPDNTKVKISKHSAVNENTLVFKFKPLPF
jgi:hypothetical protein